MRDCSFRRPGTVDDTIAVVFSQGLWDLFLLLMG